MTSTTAMEELLFDLNLEQSFGLTLFDDAGSLQFDDGTIDIVKPDPVSTSPNTIDVLGSLTSHLPDPFGEEWMEQAGLEELLKIHSLPTDVECEDESLLLHSDSTLEEKIGVDGLDLLQDLIVKTAELDSAAKITSVVSPGIEAGVEPVANIPGNDGDPKYALNGTNLGVSDVSTVIHSLLSVEDVDSFLSASEPSSPLASSEGDNSFELCELDFKKCKARVTPKVDSSPYRKSRVRNTATKVFENDLDNVYLSKKDKKKLQNKNAAIRYRMKKKQEAEAVKIEENQIEEKNQELKERVDQLQREIKYMKDLMAEVYKAKGIVKTENS